MSHWLDTESHDVVVDLMLETRKECPECRPDVWLSCSEFVICLGMLVKSHHLLFMM